MKEAALIGLGIGLVNGVLCWSGLYWAREKPDRVFYRVWLAGMLYKLAFFGGACLWLWRYRADVVVPALTGLIAGQLGVGVVPLKRARKS
jgi:hypothetical protein